MTYFWQVIKQNFSKAKVDADIQLLDLKTGRET